jgi:hypothetical protein
MASMTITEFLLARIAEDEREANEHAGAEYYTDGAWPDELPSRVLAECAAKRAITGEHREVRFFATHQGCVVCRIGDGPLLPVEYPCPTVRALAAVYKDHPDYQPEWAL